MFILLCLVVVVVSIALTSPSSSQPQVVFPKDRDEKVKLLFTLMTPSLYPLLSPVEQSMVRRHFWEVADQLDNADQWLEVF